jgi:hypothetical protein
VSSPLRSPGRSSCARAKSNPATVTPVHRLQ